MALLTRRSYYDRPLKHANPPNRPPRAPLSFRHRARVLREQALLQVAAAHVLSQGCVAFRLEDVAAACGVSRGTCYLHFPTRSALLTAATGYLDESLVERLASPPPGVKDPRDALRWAVLQGAKAQVFTSSFRNVGAPTLGEKPENFAWPCCLRQIPCPYGGAARSLEQIAHWARALRPVRRSPVAPDLLANVLVHLLPRLITVAETPGGGSRRPQEIECLVDYLIDRLFGLRKSPRRRA